MTSIKKLVQTLLDINEIFKPSTSLFYFHICDYGGKYNMDELAKSNNPILLTNIKSINGETVFLTKEPFPLIDKEYVFTKEDFALNEKDFETKFLYIHKLFNDLIKSNSFLCLFRAKLNLNNILETSPTIADNLNKYLSGCTDDQIQFLDKVGFNPFLLMNKGSNYKDLISIFESKMSNPYVMSNEHVTQIQQKYPLSFVVLSKGNDNTFWKNSKFKNEMFLLKEYVRPTKKQKKATTTNKVLSLEHHDILSFSIKKQNGKSVGEKKVGRYIFNSLNELAEKNNIPVLFVHNFAQYEISLDFIYDLDFMPEINSEFKLTLDKIIQEILNSNKLNYKEDWLIMEEKYPEIYSFIEKYKREPEKKSTSKKIEV